MYSLKNIIAQINNYLQDIPFKNHYEGSIK